MNQTMSKDQFTQIKCPPHFSGGRPSRQTFYPLTSCSNRICDVLIRSNVGDVMMAQDKVNRQKEDLSSGEHECLYDVVREACLKISGGKNGSALLNYRPHIFFVIWVKLSFFKCVRQLEHAWCRIIVQPDTQACVWFCSLVYFFKNTRPNICIQTQTK